LKRKITLAARILLLFAVVVLGLWAGLYIYLPHYLESRIIPQLVAKAGIRDFAFEIRHIGIFGADLGTLRLGPEQDPTLLIRSVQIDYSPKGLYQQKISRMTIGGIELYGEFRNGKFLLSGVDFDEIQNKLRSNQRATTKSDSVLPPIFLGELGIYNAVAVLKTGERQFRIPFEVNITPENSSYNRLSLKASIYPRGQLIRTEAEVDLNHQKIILNSKTDSLDLNRFSDLTQTDSDLMIFGNLDLQATTCIQLSPFKISATNASAELHNGKIRFLDFLAQNAFDSDNKELPLKINLSQNGDSEWEVSGSAISTTSPVPFTLGEWHGRVRTKGDRIESTGEFKVAMLPSDAHKSKILPVEILESSPLQGSFTAEYSHARSLQFRIKTYPAKQPKRTAARLNFDEYEIVAGEPTIDITGRGTPDNLALDYSLIIPKLLIASQTKTIHLPRLVLKGTADFDPHGESLPKAIFKLQSPNTRILISPARISLRDVIISGQVDTKNNGTVAIEGLLEFVGAGAAMPTTDIKISGARGVIPLKWPPIGQMKNGDISIGALYYAKVKLGGIKGKIQQTLAGFSFKGRHFNRLLADSSLNFSGNATLFNTKDPVTNIKFAILRPGHAAEIDLGQFFPKSKGVKLNGKLMLTGELAADSAGLKGFLDLQVQNANVRIKEDKFAVEGIQLSLSIPELPTIRSAAGQHLVFSEIAFGDLVAKDGRIDFQIESLRSFLIEKAHFIWCDGNVDTQSMRLSSGVDDYRITFYCDRLKLARVLEQFGVAMAQGEGTVNGRIPLQYKNGRIRFDDGFLFSTPGKGGKIRLKGTDILTAGIPPNTRQYVQMELAGEALRIMITLGRS